MKTMEFYRGFDIVRKSEKQYWIIGGGYVIASAWSIKAAKEYIDCMIY